MRHIDSPVGGISLTLICAALFVLSIPGCGPAPLPPVKKSIAWNEIVALPDGRTITVHRTEQFEGTAYNGDASHALWVRETISIPAIDGGAPVEWESLSKWKSTVSKTDNVPIDVSAIAIYFEGSLPRIVAIGTDIVDGTYGCAYTDRHRLFFWDSRLGWQYDPRTRIHTKYVGWANLIPLPETLDTLKPFSDALGNVGPMKPEWAGMRIDTLHEKFGCSVIPAQAKYRLDELLTDKP